MFNYSYYKALEQEVIKSSLKKLEKMISSSKVKLLPLSLFLPLPTPLRVNADEENFLNIFKT